MKILLDTNVLLDVLLKRVKHYEASAEVWTLCEEGKLHGCISVISFNNVFYLVRKSSGRKAGNKAMEILRDLFEPITMDGILLNQAIGAGMADFEDAIQYHCAVRGDADYLVSRNVPHFPKGGLAVVTPEELLAVLSQQGDAGEMN